MKLDRLLDQVEVTRRTGAAEVALAGLTQDSRKVAPGFVFFALPGTREDGTAYIPQALAQGAVAVVAAHLPELPPQVAGVEVANVRRALALCARNFYEDPAAGMTVIGVTGTNGKTTISYLLESVLRDAGRTPAILGTVNYRCGAQVWPSLHTTPDPLELMATLHAFRRLGADCLVMEVSSHALHQHRVDGLRFDLAIFTNLTPEHLDYHGDMASYFAAKRRLFDDLLVPGGRSVINLDDAWGPALAEGRPGVLTVGTTAAARLRSREVRQDLGGTRGRVEMDGRHWPLTSPLVGAYNLSNLLCVFGAALALGLDPERTAAALAQAPGAPGRLERIDNALGALVLVDYAHTGDALEQALRAMQALQPRRLLVVFGCGGDRDRSKRPVMGRVAGRMAQRVILTSDNPRSEDPQAILDQIAPGVAEHLAPLRDEAQPTGYLIIADRREALRRAVAMLRPGDLLLVAGKGHENYQILGTERIHFDDREELRQALAERGKA